MRRDRLFSSNVKSSPRPRIGLDPAFTIHDREDSAHLMNFRAGMSSAYFRRSKRFPLKATCLAIYSLAVNATKLAIDVVLAEQFPWCKEWESELKGLFQRTSRRKQQRNVLDYDDLLLYWAEMMSDASLATQRQAASSMCSWTSTKIPIAFKRWC